MIFTINPSTKADEVNDIVKNKMKSGDEIVLEDGLYKGIRFGQKFSSAPYNNYSVPSGTKEKYTVIRAKNLGKAILESGGISLGGAQSGISAKGTNYVRIEGIYFRKSSISLRDSKYNKIVRCWFKNGKKHDSRYGTVIALANNSDYNLIEDVAIIGSMRYGINIYDSKYNIVRRVVARYDGNSEREPKSGICFYGETSNNPGSHHGLAQNCILLDYNNTHMLGSGMQNVHSATDITYQGCIALNLPTNGFFVNEDNKANKNKVINSVACKAENGIALKDSLIGGETRIERFTALQCKDVGVAYWRSKGTKIYLIDSLFNDNGKNYDSLNVVQNVINGQNPKSVVDASNVGVGAVILKRYGKSGTLWGEAGYDQLTDEDLWPFPFENMIHAVAAEADDFQYPSKRWDGKDFNVVNDTKRGFAADGQTLTKYIFGYVGSETPPVSEEPPVEEPPVEEPPVEEPPKEEPPVEEPPKEEPPAEQPPADDKGFGAFIDAIVSFFQAIINWFKSFK